MTRLKTAVGIVFAAFGIIAMSQSEGAAQEPVHTGRPVWQAYDTRTTNGARVTYQAVLSDNGPIVAANDAGLLTFDGLHWRRFEAGPERRPLRALAPLANDSWLVGGTQTLGTFTPDPKIGLVWHDLLAEFDQEQVPIFDAIHGIVFSDDRPIILTDRSVLVLSEGSLTETVSDAPTGFAFSVDDALYVETGPTLLRLDENDSVPIATPTSWTDLTPRTVLKDSSGSHVLVTQRSGLFTLSVSSDALQLTPLWEALPLPLDVASVSAAAFLSDDSVILGTESGGLVHLGQDGSTRFNLDKRSGFRAGTIRQITPLADGSLMVFHDGGAIWLGMQTGLRLWDSVNGLSAPVISVATDDAVTYAGTEDGLYRSLSGHRMAPSVEAGPGPIQVLKRFNRSAMRGHTSLLIGTPYGLYDFYDGQLELIEATPPLAVHISTDRPSRIAVARETGIALIDYENGSWLNTGTLSAPDTASAQALTEAADGTLVAAFSDGTIKTYSSDQWLNDDVAIDPPPLKTQAIQSSESDALPIFAGQGDDIHLLSSGTQLEWNPRTESFVETSVFDTVLAKDSTHWVSATKTRNAIWAQTQEGGVVIGLDDDAFSIPLPRLTGGTADYGVTAYDAENDRVFLGSAEGLFEFSGALTFANKPLGQNPAPTVAQIQVNDDTVFSGHGDVGPIELPSENSVLKVSLAALHWGFTCNTATLVMKKTASEEVLTTELLTSACDADLKGVWQPSGATDYTFEIQRDGKSIAEPMTLGIAIIEPWVSKFWVPLALSILIATIAIFGSQATRRRWPEPIIRYLALLSGFLLLWAVGVGTNLITPSTTVRGVGLQLSSLSVAALIMPLIVEGLMRVSEHLVRRRT